MGSKKERECVGEGRKKERGVCWGGKSENGKMVYNQAQETAAPVPTFS